MGKRDLKKDLFGDIQSNDKSLRYCDACDLCIRNSMIPSRGIGEERSGAIMHIVTAPSPADNKSKIILSGTTGVFVRNILKDKGLLGISYITSVVKCGILSQVTPNSISKCFPTLQNEINKINPSIYITYGKDPYYIISGGKDFPKQKEGIELLPNGKILIYTTTLEHMKMINDYRYLDRAYDTAVECYRKFVNKWQILK